MSTFSERYGYVAPRTALQVESMDTDLRTGLWNVFYMFLVDVSASPAYEMITQLFDLLWITLYRQPLNKRFDRRSEWEAFFHRRFEQDPWNAVYDLIEETAKRWPDGYGSPRGYVDAVNHILERYCAGYRFIGTSIAPIVSEAEVAAVEDAMAATSGLPGARHHIATALGHLANRTSPDYANSIKESISAVESICGSLVGRKNASVAEAAPALTNQLGGHPALAEGWKKIYGFASNAEGIRHAGQDLPDASVDDATYFLVTCSAFVNLVTAKAAKAGVQLMPAS